jgi:hypothetical protein
LVAQRFELQQGVICLGVGVIVQKIDPLIGELVGLYKEVPQIFYIKQRVIFGLQAVMKQLSLLSRDSTEHALISFHF